MKRDIETYICQRRLILKIIRKKPFEILLNLKDNIYASKLAKEVDCTYSHTVHLLNLFEKEKLVQFHPSGRTKIITLTENGIKIRDLLRKLYEVMENK